jgi:hypothetical protein
MMREAVLCEVRTKDSWDGGMAICPGYKGRNGRWGCDGLFCWCASGESLLCDWYVFDLIVIWEVG